MAEEYDAAARSSDTPPPTFSFRYTGFGSLGPLSLVRQTAASGSLASSSLGFPAPAPALGVVLCYDALSCFCLALSYP